MERVLLDTNIVLDALFDRDPFGDPAKALWSRVVAGELRAGLAATTLTNIFYIARKRIGTIASWRVLRDLAAIFEICPVDRAVIAVALLRSMPDFEDAVQDAAAELAGVPTIVTRDARGFVGSSRRIVDAATLVAELDRAPD